MLPAYLVLVIRLSLPPKTLETWQVPQHINEDIPKIRRCLHIETLANGNITHDAGLSCSLSDPVLRRPPLGE